MVRLMMNAGLDCDVKPGDVVGFLLNETSLPREALGAISVLPKATLFDVHEDHARDIVLALRGRHLTRRLIRNRALRSRSDSSTPYACA